MYDQKPNAIHVSSLFGLHHGAKKKKRHELLHMYLEFYLFIYFKVCLEKQEGVVTRGPHVYHLILNIIYSQDMDKMCFPTYLH